MADNTIPLTLYGMFLLGMVLTTGCLVPHSPIAPPTGNEENPLPLATDARYETRFIATPLLGRPTDHAMNVQVVPAEQLILVIEYQNSTDASLHRTAPTVAEAGVPTNIVLSNLEPDTGYRYRLCYHTPGDPAVLCSPWYSFTTQREPGSPFVFDVQADSHLDERASGDLYQRTLENEREDHPDFLIDLGDTFMTDKLPVKNPETIVSQYLRQRSYFSTIGHSVPLFLVLGNHDGEAGYAAGDSRDGALLSLQFRKEYFPNPEPDGFYTGNTEYENGTGLRQDYYAWEWGDALFVVLDPYGYTTTKPGGKTDGWAWTLGEDQYQWLKQTLEESHARYTFVFAHHLVGGDLQGRGGTEYASLYEWGGENPDGSWGFDQHRPSWGMPIHQLLVENNVTAFFHGHDHLYARQELDGVIYQGVPQPATMSSPKASPGAEYGYVNGVMLASPGHLRVSVSPASVRVDYIGSSLPGDTRSNLNNGAVVYSYTVVPS
jgi:hypothetical protein